MKRVIDKNVGFFKKAKKLIQPNVMRSYSFNGSVNYDFNPLSAGLSELHTFFENMLQQANLNGDEAMRGKQALINILGGAVKAYNSQLEQAKVLMDEGQVKEPKDRLNQLTIELEQVHKILNDHSVNSSLLQAYSELLAKAYTYVGITYSIGTKGEDIALGKFEKALNLIPDYELPRKKIEAILIGRGILPNGETLVFENEEESLGKNQVNPS